MIFRYSQNGPYITIKFEAKDQEKYDERKNYRFDQNDKVLGTHKKFPRAQYPIPKGIFIIALKSSNQA